MSSIIINPFIQVSENVVAETTTVADSFTGANGTSVSSRNSDSGDTWTTETGSLTFENNALHNPSNTVGIATFDKGWGNVSMKCNMTQLQSGEEMGFVFRYTDSLNYWRATINFGGNPFRIYRVTAGVETLVTFNTSAAFSAAAFELELNGDTVTVYSDSTYILTYTGVNSQGSSSTKHGIYMKKPSTDANNATRGNLDSFVAYSYAALLPANQLNKLVVNTPTSWQTLQRTGTTADIAISGKFLYDGAAHDIEASFNGGAYQTIATGRLQTFSGILTNQAQGQGTLTVRLKDNTAKSFSLIRVGIGDIFLSCGQSNSADTGLFSTKSTSPSTGGIYSTVFYPFYRHGYMADPISVRTGQIDTVSNTSPAPIGSYGIPLATLLMTDQGVPMCIIPCGAGGTSISQWQKGSSATDRTTLFGSAVYRALQQPNGIKAVLMHQGESDVTSASPTNTTTVTTLMSQFVTDMVAALGSNLKTGKVVISKIHKWDDAPATNQTNVDNWQTAIDNVISGNSNAVLGANFDKPSRVGGSLHFTSDGEKTDASNRLWLRLKALFY